MGLAALINAAEIAYHQGLDLYAEFTERITTAMEFHADIILGSPWPTGLCQDSLNISVSQTWEIAYNHYHNRIGKTLPQTEKLIQSKVRPSGVGLHMVWESMTHAELNAGSLPIRAPLPKALKRFQVQAIRENGRVWLQWRSGEGKRFGLNGVQMNLEQLPATAATICCQ